MVKAYIEQISPHPMQRQIRETLSNNSPFLIGREPGKCQVVLDSNYYQGVSRLHLEIRPLKSNSPYGQSGWEVNDLSSGNGTYVNGTRLRTAQILQPGDRIRLGKKGPEFIFHIQGGVTPPQQAVPPTVYENSYVQTPHNPTTVPPPAAKPVNSDLWVKIIPAAIVSIGVLYMTTKQPTPSPSPQASPTESPQPSSSGGGVNVDVLREYFDFNLNDAQKKEITDQQGNPLVLVIIPVQAKSGFDANSTKLGVNYYNAQGNQLGQTIPMVFKPEVLAAGEQGAAAMIISKGIEEEVKAIEVVRM